MRRTHTSTNANICRDMCDMPIKDVCDMPIKDMCDMPIEDMCDMPIGFATVYDDRCHNTVRRCGTRRMRQNMMA